MHHIPRHRAQHHHPDSPPATSQARSRPTTAHPLQGPAEMHQTSPALLDRLASLCRKVIPAGRIFVCRLINASTTVDTLHHHLRLSAATKADIECRLQFAHTWYGKAFFLDHSWIPSLAFQLYTDASQQGYGCFWQGQWLRGSWTKCQAKRDI